VVRETYSLIETDVWNLHIKWGMFRQLYGTSEERIHLLNDSAPLFFSRLDWILLDHIILELSKLTDQPGSGDRESLVLGRLRGASKSEEDEQQFREALIALESSLADLRRHRNKRIAHKDLRTAQKVLELPGISRQKIEASLSALRLCINAFRSQFMAPMMFEISTSDPSADKLVEQLVRASYYREMEQENPELRLRLRTGRFKDI
jgi:hypothetical protein